MSHRRSISPFDPLSIVRSWQQLGGTVSSAVVAADSQPASKPAAKAGNSKKVAAGGTGPSSQQRLMAHAEKLPPETRQLFLDQAAAKQAERAARPSPAELEMKRLMLLKNIL